VAVFPDKTGVLVIGGGNAALCAAISAREAGAEVVLLEHAHRAMRGGNSRHTRNLRAAHAAPTATLTGTYTEEEYWQDLLRVTAGETDEQLARMMIRKSAELQDWLGPRGVHFQPALTGTLSLGRTNAFFLGGGKALLNALYDTAEKLGIRVFYNSEAQALDIADGVFRSATVVNRGFAYEVKAEAVVVASGGFQANVDWLKAVWGDAAQRFIIRGTPYNRGRLLKDLMKKGMKSVGDPAQCHAIAVDGRAPRFDGGIVTRLDCVCFGIVVNQDCQRFYDEGEDFWPQRYAIWGRLIARQPDQIAYAIVDSKLIHNFMPSVFPAIKAENIADLAGLVGLDRRALEQTVTEFNAAVSPGTYAIDALDDCSTRGIQPPKTHWALPLDKPPYYAYPLRTGITFTYLGLRVNERAQVLLENGAPTKNIFAAGEIMAGNILGKGYCAGTGMSIGSVFGRIAGEAAACVRRR